MIQKNNKASLITIEILALLMTLVCLLPFYFLFSNSLKPYKDIALNPTSFPKMLYLDNYVNAFKVLKYPAAFANSLIVTVISNITLVIVGSMAAYRLVRHNTRINKLIFLIFVSAMVIPFQSIMIPMVIVSNRLGLINSYAGVVFVYLGVGVSFTIFLFHGFSKSIPLDIEEAASIDGCSYLAVFWKINFPLLKPVIVTVLVLNGLWIWNDFLLPLLIIPAERLRTIPLAINSLFSQYTKKWDLAMAALVMSIIPSVTAFLILQKSIIDGIVAGSVKG
jgi:raffinose/stachyose/melibiose transport system permease protein